MSHALRDDTRAPRNFEPRLPAPAQRLIGVAPSAATLGISVRSFYRLLRTGELPCVRVGGRTLVALTDIDAYVARNTGAFLARKGA
jgi:excisionase family DNA binding protein